jgi:phenylacetate-CoA ligase
MYLINGAVIAKPEAAAVLAELRTQLADTLSQSLDVQQVLRCAEQFVAQLDVSGSELGLSTENIDALRLFCHREALEAKLQRELGDQPFSLRRFDYQRPYFSAWRPLGLVIHITSANAPLLPFMAVLESLLVGNINWLRPSRQDQGISARLLAEFLRHDASGQLMNYVAVLPLSLEELAQILPFADGVSAWGGGEALSAIRHQLPAGCRWIEWGHRISFAWLDPTVATDADYDAVANDVCSFNQQACSSPQCVLIDSDDPAMLQQVAQKLAAAMGRRAAAWPSLLPGVHEAAEISSQMAFLRLDNAFIGIESGVEQGEGWRVGWANRQELVASPLFRTVQLRPAPRARLTGILLPWRKYLQTCALVAAPAELAALSRQLLAAGVSRICPVGAMHDSYAGEPHDGVYALQRLSKRVSVRLAAGQLSGHATLDTPPAPPIETALLPVMDKTVFQQRGISTKAQLFFRSGGSSGTPKLAGFSYRDYHRQMLAAAEGLFAAGLDPAQDRAMNLLFGGNLYGGFLSFFTMLDKLSVVQYPMGGPEDDDFSEVAHFIVEQRINTLIGMPGTLHQLFMREEAKLRNYGGVRKIFYGGEQMSAVQRQFLLSFGEPLICPAIYGSVDAGPLGHACSHGNNGEFHLLADTQWLEILAQDRDKPVAVGEIGRLVFTSLAREGQQVQRYDVGDLGRWLPGDCGCHLPTPRFELTGRHGALLRVGTIFINPTGLSADLQGSVQWLIDSAPNGSDRIRLLIDGECHGVREQLLQQPMMAQIVAGGLLTLEICATPVTKFQRHPQSGKTPLVIDSRYLTAMKR